MFHSAVDCFFDNFDDGAETKFRNKSAENRARFFYAVAQQIL